MEGYIVGLVGQKYWGWGYDTIQIIYDSIVYNKKYFSNDVQLEHGKFSVSAGPFIKGKELIPDFTALAV